MNNKLAGGLFIMFGMGLLGSSIEDMSSISIGLDKETFRAIVGIILGISSSIYGYKRMKMDKAPNTKNATP